MSKFKKRTPKEIQVLALEIAALSPSLKRKVGAVIAHKEKGHVYATGFNNTSDSSPCEINGKTTDKIVHAEINAINHYIGLKESDGYIDESFMLEDLIMYITHEPCSACKANLRSIGIKEYIVVNEFMKFDTAKLRYELIPPKALKALATILTFGARAYKPNNWQKINDPNRYIGAAMRHFEAYRAGKVYDEDSGFPHLWHLFCNIGFLIHLDFNPTEFLEIDKDGEV